MSASDELTLGVISTTRKADEKRLPLHPAHFERIDEQVRRRMIVERGYGERFHVSDDRLRELVGRVASHGDVVQDSDIVLLPKPQPEDLRELRDGQILWGWPHCVQDRNITQTAIDKQLTLIAFEAMNHWASDGGFSLHVFHKNNELAGYCSIMHAMALIGSTGDYGRRLSAAVIGFGATARGAVTALGALGVHEVRVLTSRDVAAVASPIPAVEILQVEHDATEPFASHVLTEHDRRPLAEFLAENDIVVNCTLQDPTAPLTYLTTADLPLFSPGSLIVDVSVDEGMGFSWAVPTTFAEPMFTVGDGVNYYAVDHSPSYLWDSATWEISEALLPFLPVVLAGEAAWDSDETISRAIEIRHGRIQNPNILSFQDRSEEYPYRVR